MLLFTTLEIFVETVTMMPVQLLVNGSVGMLSCMIMLNTDLGPDTSSLSVLWYHNGNNITMNNKYNSLLDRLSNTQFNSTLSISNVDETDGGVYKCSAEIIGSKRKMSAERDVCVEGTRINNNY